MKRTLVIGDIHGGLVALRQVMELASVTPKDNLIFLGDYVDGWSESAGVIKYMMELDKQQSCIFIKGNHDVWCEDWLLTGQPDKTWLQHGGQETAKSYAAIPADARLAHLAFFQQMKLYWVDDQNRLFIHAGFTSMHGPERESHASTFTLDRTLWETAVTMDKKIARNSLLFPKRLKHFQEIYIGHTPTLYYNETTPMHGCNVWNVDTGAAFTGPLTIMDVDTKQYWQSNLLRDCYPLEQGRNRG